MEAYESPLYILQKKKFSGVCICEREPQKLGLFRDTSMEMGDIRSERTQKLKELKPNSDRREKTGAFLTQIAKFAIDSTINYSLKFKALAG